MPSGQGDDDGSRRGQGDLPDKSRPARERRPRHPKEEENPAKEAFDRGPLAQFFLGPSWGQAGALLLAFGVPGHKRYGSQAGMDPVDQLQAPIGSIQADDAGMQVVEASCQFEQGTGKGGIMRMGGPDQEVHGQAGSATEQRMHAIAAQEWTRMVSRGVPQGSIGILSALR